MHVLERVEHRVAWLRSQEDRCVAVREMEVDEQRRPGLELRQRGGDVDGHRGRADAALGANKGEHLAFRAGRAEGASRG